MPSALLCRRRDPFIGSDYALTLSSQGLKADGVTGSTKPTRAPLDMKVGRMVTIEHEFDARVFAKTNAV